jgi:hypothetical protein
MVRNSNTKAGLSKTAMGRKKRQELGPRVSLAMEGKLQRGGRHGQQLWFPAWMAQFPCGSEKPWHVDRAQART